MTCFSLAAVDKELNITVEELKKDVFLKKIETGVFFLVLNRKVNSFNIPFVREINRLLD